MNPQIHVSYRCLPAHLLEPKERPFFCHSSEANGHEFRVGCCSDEDSCNGNLTVTLSPEPIIGKEQRGTDSTEWLFSSLPSCEIFNVFCLALTISFREGPRLCDFRTSILSPIATTFRGLSIPRIDLVVPARARPGSFAHHSNGGRHHTPLGNLTYF